MNARPHSFLLLVCLASFMIFLLLAAGDDRSSLLLKIRDKNADFRGTPDIKIPDVDVFKIKEGGYKLNKTELETIKRFTEQYKGPKGYWPHNHSENLNLFEGDIANVNVSNLKTAVWNSSMMWPRGRVPYVISPVFAPRTVATLRKVFHNFRKKTCIQFVKRTHEYDYIAIKHLPEGCSSSVGRQGGAQTVSIGRGCVHIGVIEHELMHVLGFWHEQSRPDRDKHVIINWLNVQPGSKFVELSTFPSQFCSTEANYYSECTDSMILNFLKFNMGRVNMLNLPYDVSSVLHYGAFEFSKNHSYPTVIPRYWMDFLYIGQRRGFSGLDVIKINKLYNCKMSYDEPFV